MREFACACAPAQAVAAGTRFLLAPLPALIEGARREYGDRPGIAGFVLPFAVSTFKLNTPIRNLVGPLFPARLYGISPGDMAVATILEGRVPEAPVAPGDATPAPPAAPSTRGEAPRPAGA